MQQQQNINEGAMNSMSVMKGFKFKFRHIKIESIMYRKQYSQGVTSAEFSSGKYRMFVKIYPYVASLKRFVPVHLFQQADLKVQDNTT